MAKVSFRVSDDRGAPAAGKPAEAIAEPAAERSDTFWWDSAWELLHGLDVIETGFRTREEWNATINLMKGNGADGTAEQFAQLSDYLIRYHSSLNVNKATADDIEAWLDVDDKVAQAIVDHRNMNGAFKTIDDLKKVPGIDAAKVDARKVRALF